MANRELERDILFQFEGLSVRGRLKRSRVADAVWDALPIEGRGQLWGEELYFYISLRVPPENPKDVVDRGDIAYWPEGPGLCLFWGPTPVSRGEEIRPYSPVEVIGKVIGNLSVLKNIRPGRVIVKRLEEV